MSEQTTIVFNAPGTFGAGYAAEKWLRDNGFSVGSSQVCAPRAIWFGDCYISKWRGLSKKDMATMDARMDGGGRNETARITLLSTASPEARAAFAKALGQQPQEVPRVRGHDDPKEQDHG